MKKNCFRLCAIFLASMVSMSVMAQESVPTTPNIQTGISIGIGVAPRTMLYKNGDDRSMFGMDVTFAIEGLRENNLEGEAEFTLRYNSDSEETKTLGTLVTNKLELSSLLIVPSIGYRFQIPNTKFSVTPLVGLFFDNVLGAKQKTTSGGKTTTIDLTDKDDVGLDNMWSMALGYEGALKLRFSDKFYVKARYGHTLLKYTKNVGYSYWGIMAAYTYRF